MIVGTRMRFPVITVKPDLSIQDALNLLHSEHIRRAPVVKGGKLVGIITDDDLLHASPSPATSLSIWELNYLISKITVRDVMTKQVITVDENTPIEEAARIMADNKIGGLPVLRDGKVVGIITETDLFKIFLELLGARETGVRVTALVPEKPGQLAKVTKAVADAGGNFIAFGVFAGENITNRSVTCKISGLTLDQVRSCLAPVIDSIQDIRTV